MKLGEMELSDLTGTLTFLTVAILFWKFILAPMV